MMFTVTAQQILSMWDGHGREGWGASGDRMRFRCVELVLIDWGVCFCPRNKPDLLRCT